MARNISVKVPVAKLIEQIEGKIADIEEAEANYPAIRKQYEAEQAQYKKDVIEFVSNYLKNNSNRIGYEYSDPIRLSRHYGNRFEVSFDVDAIEDFPKDPEEPQRPNGKEWFGRDYTTRKHLLEKNLTILKMTSQEEVSASTYGAIMEIL